MKLTKSYLRKVIKEEIDNLSEEQKLEPKTAKAIAQLEKAPGLKQALDLVQDEVSLKAVLNKFVEMLTQRGVNKSKLVNVMRDMFMGAKDVKPGDVGKSAPKPEAN